MGRCGQDFVAQPLGPEELLLLLAGGTEAAAAAGEGDQDAPSALAAPEPGEAPARAGRSAGTPAAPARPPLAAARGAGRSARARPAAAPRGGAPRAGRAATHADASACRPGNRSPRPDTSRGERRRRKRRRPVAHKLMRNLMPPPPQLLCELAHTLTGPTQRRLRVATCGRLDQSLQIGHQGGILLDRPLPSRGRPVGGIQSECRAHLFEGPTGPGHVSAGNAPLEDEPGAYCVTRRRCRDS
jgi:hypothetical protein